MSHRLDRIARLDGLIAVAHAAEVRAEDACHTGEVDWWVFEILRLETARDQLASDELADR